MPANQPSSVIVLKIRSQGHVPSFKNNKRLFLTNPKHSAWMKQAIQSIESQLLTAAQIGGIETMTAHSLRSWIASSVPLDDSRHWIIEATVRSIEVPKGQEGCDIMIERLEGR